MTGRLPAVESPPGAEILRILITATLISRVGRGIYLSVSVLYFTFVVGLSAGEVATVLAASSAVGIGASFAGGWLADRFSARRLLVVFSALEGATLIGYVVADGFIAALVVGIGVGAFGQSANTARMAIIARAFEGEERVRARAILRTVTNVSIAVGSGIGAVALAVGTPLAYRVLLVVAGLAYIVAVLRLRKLPASADAEGVARAAGDAASRTARVKPRGRSPWRDRRFVMLTALCAVFGMQFGVGELAVPLWIAHDTRAPEVLVAAVLILNTIIVVCFQVPLSRGTHDLRTAARASATAAWLMAGACVVYALAGGMDAVWAIVVVVTAAVAHAFAEVLSQASGWGLSFELADPARAGEYQGLFSAGYSIGATAAPLVVAATTDSLGVFGWGILAAVFLASGLGVWALARRAARSHVLAETTRPARG